MTTILSILLSLAILFGAKSSFYLFPLILTLTVYNSKNAYKNYKLIIKNEIPLIISLTAPIIIFIFQWKLIYPYHLDFFKEILHGINLFLIIAFFVGTLEYEKLTFFIKQTSYISFFIITAFCILGLIKAIYLLLGFTQLNDWIANKANLFTIRQDYNTHSFLATLGIILSRYLCKNSKASWLLFLLFSLNATLSFSRRGFIFYCLITTYYFYLFTKSHFPKKIQYLILPSFFCLFFISLNFIIQESNQILYLKNLDHPNIKSSTSIHPNFNYWKDQITSPTPKPLDKSTLGRIEKLEKSLKIIKSWNLKNYIWGEGLTYIKVFSTRINKYDHPHNALISNFLFGGILYSLIVIFWFFQTITRLFTSLDFKKYPEIIIVIFYLSLISLSSYNFIFVNGLLVGLLLLINVFYRLEKGFKY